MTHELCGRHDNAGALDAVEHPGILEPLDVLVIERVIPAGETGSDISVHGVHVGLVDAHTALEE